MNVELPRGCTFRSRERHADQRGSFLEIARATEGTDLAQAALSTSTKGALRGLHFHRRQTDVWHLLDGRVQIALVDLSGEAPVPVVFEWHAADPGVLLIPPLVAHGYLALEETRLLYLFSREYDGADEFGVAWDDPQLAIAWADDNPLLSERDRNNDPLADVRGRL